MTSIQCGSYMTLMKYTLLLQSSIEEKLANTFELMIFSTLYTSIPHKLKKKNSYGLFDQHSIPLKMIISVSTNLFLYSYEYQWINKQRIRKKSKKAIQGFKSCSRYIDDLLLINNYDLMKEVMTEISPKELVLVPNNNNGRTAPFLDLQLLITEGVISTSIYDKRDAFDFPIVNFPSLSGNIPNRSAYGTFICELVRYARGCTFLSVKWADELGESLTDIRTYMISPTEEHQQKLCAESFGNNESNMIKLDRKI